MRSPNPFQQDMRDNPTGIDVLQRAFAAALMWPDGELPVAVSGPTQAQRVKRFNVYRNNVHASLAAALRARFPVVERLVGAEFFMGMAVLFIRQQLPSSPVLAEYGGNLPDFLERFEPAASVPYLPDVARLEWARNRAYHAADAQTVAISALADTAPERLGDVRLQPHPATQVIASLYPIVSIWATNTHDEIVRPIGTEASGECALVTRPGLDVLVTPVPLSAATFIDALAGGRTLADAATTANAAEGDFDLAAALAAAFGSGAIGAIARTDKAF